MINRIYKFLGLGWSSGKYEVSLPKGTKVLSVQNQKGAVVLWAIVNTDELENELRVFRVYYTGEEYRGGKFLGTVQLQGGDLVLHVFEEA